MLADEEIKHFKVFEKMSKNEELPSISHLDVQEVARDIFTKIKTCNRKYSFTEDQVAYYEKAAKIEDDAAKFYTQTAHEMKDEAQKKGFPTHRRRREETSTTYGKYSKFCFLYQMLG